MPVMRCDTPRQGQLWMHHEEIATTSDFCDQSTPKSRSKPRSLNLDDEHLSTLQMADPGSTSNNNNNNNNNKIRVHFNERLQVNAICDKLKNNAGFEMDAIARPSEDEDCESSSSFDSGGGNDAMGSSSFGDDMGSCENDGVGNDDDDGDDASYVEMDGDDYGQQVIPSLMGQNGPECDGDDMEEDLADGEMDILEREADSGDDSDEQALCIDTKEDGANESEEGFRLMDSKTENVVNSSHGDQPAALERSPADCKIQNHLTKNETAERRNKRKNFKPRNIVHQNYDVDEEAQSEFLEEYHLGNSWEAAAAQRRWRLDSHSPSLTKETESAKSPNLSPSSRSSPPGASLAETAWRRSRDAEQPLDLSDCASVVSRTRSPPSHYDRPGEEQRPSSRQEMPGAPMDLTMSRGAAEAATSKGASWADGAICDAMDLSKGPVPNSSSNASVEPNYATSFTAVSGAADSGSSACTSSGLSTSAAYQQLLGATGHPLMPLPGLTGISASLLGLPSATHSSASVRAARAAAAAHAAAMGLVQAVRDCEEGHESSGPLPTAIDASTMKDYAESTMKELLGLYGINDMAESITKDVPLPNFSSVKILENMSTPLAMLSHLPPTSSPKSHPAISSPVPTTASAGLPSMHSTPHSSSFSRMSTTVTPSSASTSASMAIRTSEQLYESFQSQMVDSVNKLTNLSPNNIIGNPRVILPHNMSTILTLAAMQKTKGHGAHSASHSVSSSSFGRGKHQSLDPSMAQLLTPRSHGLSTSLYKEGKSSPVDYSRYVKRYSSSNECGHNSCKDLNYREHFHCLDCNSRVFVKKEEMIRHFKWHKKRDESLQHGFLRYSPMDDCSEKFPGCSHNRKQTHYHCLKDGCEKVYISTSDVQMHANYHRKDSAIIQEGFQRFRATEDCATPYCAFSGQRTTHFHCRRATCNFTFKNKADMEKHKSYHIKDEQLNKDGFKKFMKHEHCSFENCRFSRVCNHIHCIRPGCVYVLHSSGQLYSHKRKHERRENEMAYRKFKLAQSMMRTLGENQVLALQSIGDELKASEYASQLQGSMPMMTSPTGGLQGSLGPSSVHGLTPVPANSMSLSDAVQQSLSKYTSAFLAAGGSQHLDQAFAAHGFVPGPEHLSVFDLSADLLKARLDDSWKKYLSRYTANDPCKPNCDFLYKDHYHCSAENCTMVFRSKDGVREHARNHEQQDQVTEAFYTTVDAGQTNCCPSDCPHQSKERHYHCGWQSCREIILPSDKPFRRLDHYKMHEYSHKLNFSKEYSSDPLAFHLSSSLDGIFKRKRGRPPKNRIIEFPVTSGSSDVPQAIYTSFKLPKPNSLPTVSLFDKMSSAGCTSTSTSPTVTKPLLPPEFAMASAGLLTQNLPQQKVEVQDGFYVYPKGTPCSTPVCSMFGKNHYHCAQPRCFFITERNDVLVLHSKDFHDNIDILEGFAFFDRSVDCRLPGCMSNEVNRHFHCVRPNCNYSFVRYSTMSQHNEKHRLTDSEAVENNGVSNANASSKKSPIHIKTECPSPQSTSPSLTISEPRTPIPGKPTVIKATGTYYPLSAFPQAYGNKDGFKQSPQPSSVSGDSEATSRVLSAPDQESNGGKLSAEWQVLLESHVAYGVERSCGRAFCKLRNRDHVHCTFCNQAYGKLMQLQRHIQKHMGSASPTGNSSRLTNSEDDLSDRLEEDDDGGSEGRRREEETSNDSNASSNPFATHPRSSPSTDSTPSSQHLSYSATFLATSAASHSSGDVHQTFPSGPCPSGASAMSFLLPGGAVEDHRFSPPHRNGSSGVELDADHSPRDSMPESGIPSPIDSLESDPSSPRLAANLKRPVPTPMGSLRFEDGPESKKSKMACLRILKDEPVPEGYVRYRFNEDCQYTHCGYREHQTHFHCMRIDCGYSFCDKTRFVQHTARHERLDTLMGGDFQQFRANVSCGRPGCIYMVTQGSITNKASHFHCFKCEFVCTDTNKVVAHRRQHQKLDTIMAAGFEKFTASQSCNTESCSHNQRQTHYHCLKCQYAVLGLSQMSAHKYRHLE